MSAYEPYPPTGPHHPGGPVPIAASDLLASRWRRFFALLLDWVIVFAPIFLAGFLFGFFDSSTEYSDEEIDVIAGLIGLGAGVLYAFAYLPLLMARRGANNGQTIGKQALGVRVVTAEGVPVTYGRALRRELLGNILLSWFTAGIYSIVDYAFGLFDSRRQCLHDKIGSTYVIDESIPFGDGRPVLPPRNASPYPPGPYAPPYGQQQPAPPYGQQPCGQPQHQPPPPSAPQPAPPFGSHPSTLYDRPSSQEPAGETLYPREPGPAATPDAAPAPQAPPAPPAPQAPPAPPSQPAAEPARPQHRWTPPRQGDGNDEARRAFGDS